MSVHDERARLRTCDASYRTSYRELQRVTARAEELLRRSERRGGAAELRPAASWSLVKSRRERVRRRHVVPRVRAARTVDRRMNDPAQRGGQRRPRELHARRAAPRRARRPPARDARDQRSHAARRWRPRRPTSTETRQATRSDACATDGPGSFTKYTTPFQQPALACHPEEAGA